MVTPAVSVLNNVKITTTIITAGSRPRTNKPKPFSSTLKSLSRSGKLDKALHLVESEPSKAVKTDPDIEAAYAKLLHACITQKSFEHGRRLYLQLLFSRHNGLFDNPVVKSKLITLFSVCGRLDEAHRVFNDGLQAEHVPEQVWVAMAIGYSRNGFPGEALLLYCRMLSLSVQQGNFAFSVALKACSDLVELRIGQAVHAQMIKSSEQPDQVVYNALLKFYSDCGCSKQVLKVFEGMPSRNIVSWNSLINVFVHKDQLFEAFEIFRRMMQEEEGGFTWVTFTTMFSVCARLTVLYSGKEIHAQIVKAKAKPDVLVLNSLMDMYAKCGVMEYSRRVFDEMQSRDLASWNTMLTGYAINGCMIEAIELFDEMVDSGFRPDGITFIAMLSGCSHAGLTNEGQNLFYRMSVEFGVSPSLEHYACLVDILGRSGRIKEALDVIKNMPMKPGGSIWGSLLNSCRLHRNISLAGVIANKLFEIEPNNPGNYVMLSNIYANARIWDGVNMVREMMETRAIKKEAGCSWIQTRNRICFFVSSGASEFQNSEAYKIVWNELTDAMEKAGYQPNTRVVLHEVNEEMKAEWVCGHSERLAMMFGLIHTGHGTPVRITKNLRVCEDCHSWLKFASKITKRLIILRDTNRFHHFDKGTCSCKDYW